MGFDVSIPLTESALRCIHSNSRGYVVKTVRAEAFDWLYVLRPGGAEYVLQECPSGRRSVTPQEKHLIGAVAESGLLQLP